LDSTFVKSSPSAAGALKKRAASDRSDEGRKTTRDQGSRDRRQADASGRAKTLAWERWRRARQSRTYRNLNVKRLKSKSVLMERAYEGDETRQTARDVGLKPVVPPKHNRRKPWRYNKKLYKRRNEVERFFRRIKDFRRIATRYEKLDVMFSAFLNFVTIVILLNS